MIVVWFSCGVASAVAANSLSRYPNETVRIVNSPVIEEDPTTCGFCAMSASGSGAQ